MIAIAKALKSRWTATGLGSHVTGGIHHSRVPERTATPYCIFRELGNPVFGHSRGLRFSELQIEFRVYSKTGNAETVGDLAQLIRDEFANAEQAQSSPLTGEGDLNIMDAYVTRNIHVEDDGDEQMFVATFEMGFRFNENRNLRPS